MNYSILSSNLIIRNTLLGLLAICLIAGGILLWMNRYLETPIAALDSPVIFEVPAGSSLARVTRDLESAGYIEHPQIFTLLARWRGEAGSLKAGEYELQSGLSPAGLLATLVEGNTRQYRITLVEGWTIRQALEAIWASEKITRQLQAYDTAELAAVLELEGRSPEGQLFPDTYFYVAGTSDVQILRRAHARLNQVLASAWERRLGALPYNGPYDALILASIIEKESAFGAERGHIAGVFIRRLETGMRLQSDPTVIYGLGEAFDGNLTRSHLEQVTAYNTYRIAGLPPSPIALAGLESIEASLNPLPSDYLYFVSKGNGEHQFSSTLEEHNAAVRLYQSGTANE